MSCDGTCLARECENVRNKTYPPPSLVGANSMKYFGTDGFRGRANEGLDVEHAYKIGRFVGWYYGARQAQEGPRGPGQGHPPLQLHVRVRPGEPAWLPPAPTPTCSTSSPLRASPTRSWTAAFDCGIMITASHNPYTDNGIKLVNGEGYKMDEDVLELIESLHRRRESRCRWPPVTPSAAPSTTCKGRNRYIAHLIASANFSLAGREGRPGLRQRRCVLRRQARLRRPRRRRSA